MYTIVESRNVHHLGEARFQGILSTIHSLRHRTCGVELMAKVLQMLGDVSALLAPLFWYLVAYAPHHD